MMIIIITLGIYDVKFDVEYIKNILYALAFALTFNSTIQSNMISKSAYHYIYKFYIWHHDLDAIEPSNEFNDFDQKSKQNKQYNIKYPQLWIVTKVGMWNLILLTMIYFIASFCLETNNAMQLNDANKAYVPHYKRWNKLNWLKM